MLRSPDDPSVKVNVISVDWGKLRFLKPSYNKPSLLLPQFQDNWLEARKPPLLQFIPEQLETWKQPENGWAN